MLGIYSAAENRATLDRLEKRLSQRGLSAEEREDAELHAAELRAWLTDLWRIEGGGAGE